MKQPVGAVLLLFFSITPGTRRSQGLKTKKLKSKRSMARGPAGQLAE